MTEALQVLARQFTALSADESSAFYAMTRDDFDDALRRLRDERDAQVTMMLIASAEAALQRDRKLRLDKKLKKDPLWMAIHALVAAEKAAGQKGIRLGKLVEVWCKASGEPLKPFRSLIQRRHWLAHGRFWSDMSGVAIDPAQASRIIDDAFAKLKTFQSDFPLA